MRAKKEADADDPSQLLLSPATPVAVGATENTLKGTDKAPAFTLEDEEALFLTASAANQLVYVITYSFEV